MTRKIRKRGVEKLVIALLVVVMICVDAFMWVIWSRSSALNELAVARQQITDFGDEVRQLKQTGTILQEQAEEARKARAEAEAKLKPLEEKAGDLQVCLQGLALTAEIIGQIRKYGDPIVDSNMVFTPDGVSIKTDRGFRKFHYKREGGLKVGPIVGLPR